MADILIDDGKPDFWDEASTQLMRRDRILKKVIPRHRSEWLVTSSTPFMTLARAIVGQQVSTKSADATWARFTDRCGRRPAPAKVAEISLDELRTLGLSRRKCEYIVDLATHFAEKKV